MSSSTSFYNSNLNVDRIDLSVRVAALESASAAASTKLTQLEDGKLPYKKRTITNYNGTQVSVQFLDGIILLYNQILAGAGVSRFFISPSENKVKTLYFTNDPIGPNCYFNLDLQRTAALTGLKDPVNNYDAATKQYVDSHILSSASQITLTPVGQVTATNVQAAIADLDARKADSRGTVTLFSDQTIQGTKTFGQYIKAGWGTRTCRFSPEDNSIKTLYFSNTSVGANCQFSLDLERKVTLTNLKDPANDYDAATKKYVDDKLSPFYAATKSRPKLIQKLTNLLEILNQIPEDRLGLAIQALESLSSTQTISSQANPSNNM